MRTVKRYLSGVSLLALQGLWAQPILAQEPAPPASPVKREQASSGATNLAGPGFEGASKKAEDKDASELELSAGGLGAVGNSRSLALTGSGRYRLRRTENQLTALLAGNYGSAAAKPETGMQTTVENLQARARYDRFLSGEFALFAAGTLRRDRFQGLDLRLNLDPGVAYYFIDEKAEQFWGELGYDLQHDVRRDDAIAKALTLGYRLDKSATRHSARAFVGYQNSLNESVSFSTGLEYIQGFSNTENFRINWDAGIHSTIGGGFSVATTFSLKYDNKPLPGIKDADAVTAVSLAYKF